MNSGLQTSTDPVQARWNQYYTSRDFAESAKTFHEIMTPPRGMPYVSASETQVLYEVPIHTPHAPVDNRPAGDRRANRRRYKKAKAYFDKTFIVTKAQAWWAGVIWVGSVLLNSALLFMVFNHWAAG